MKELPEFSVVRPTAWPGLTLVSATYTSHASAPHAHAEAALGICLEGLDEFHCGSFHGPVAPGSLLAIEPGQIHWDRAARGRIQMIYAAPELLGPEPWGFASPVVDDPVLRAALEGLFPGADSWSLFVKLLKTRPWVRNLARRTSAFQPLLNALETENPSLGTLAAKAGLSPWAFLRRFRQEVGCTPHEYSRQARIIRAADQIARGVPVAEAAVDHEFYDQSHFHRHFRTIYAVSPGVFRNRNSVQS